MSEVSASLLIPAFNAASHLPSLIDDARSQAPRFSEIIVYDDASTDDTIEIAKALGVDLVIGGKINKGAAFARNRLIDAATAPWVHFHDADDRLDPSYLAVVSKCRPQNDEIIFCGLKIYDVPTKSYGESYEFTALNDQEDIGAFLSSNFPMGCGLYPLEALKSVGGFREEVRGGEDFDLHIRMKMAGTRFRAIPDVLNTYCRYGNQTFTERHTAKLHRDVLTIYERYEQELPASAHSILAGLAMQLAYKLYANDQIGEANQAIELSQRLGQNTVASTHAYVRFISRLLGIKSVFFLRKLCASIRTHRAKKTNSLQQTP